MFSSQERGRQTQQERVLGALIMGAFGIILGTLAWCIGSVLTGNSGWFGLYVAVSTIFWAALGYLAPRWLREIIGTLLMIMTF